MLLADHGTLWQTTVAGRSGGGLCWRATRRGRLHRTNRLHYNHMMWALPAGITRWILNRCGKSPDAWIAQTEYNVDKAAFEDLETCTLATYPHISQTEGQRALVAGSGRGGGV